jgi:hypothetical protein
MIRSNYCEVSKFVEQVRVSRWDKTSEFQSNICHKSRPIFVPVCRKLRSLERLYNRPRTPRTCTVGGGRSVAPSPRVGFVPVMPTAAFRRHFGCRRMRVQGAADSGSKSRGRYRPGTFWCRLQNSLNYAGSGRSSRGVQNVCTKSSSLTRREAPKLCVQQLGQDRKATIQREARSFQSGAS